MDTGESFMSSDSLVYQEVGRRLCYLMIMHTQNTLYIYVLFGVGITCFIEVGKEKGEILYLQEVNLLTCRGVFFLFSFK